MKIISVFFLIIFISSPYLIGQSQFIKSGQHAIALNLGLTNNQNVTAKALSLNYSIAGIVDVGITYVNGSFKERIGDADIKFTSYTPTISAHIVKANPDTLSIGLVLSVGYESVLYSIERHNFYIGATHYDHGSFEENATVILSGATAFIAIPTGTLLLEPFISFNYVFSKSNGQTVRLASEYYFLGLGLAGAYNLSSRITLASSLGLAIPEEGAVSYGIDLGILYKLKL
jgi:hypothetical protein